MGISRINRCQELETEFRSGTSAKRIYLERLLSSCRALLTRAVGRSVRLCVRLWVCRVNPASTWPSQDIVSLCSLHVGIHHALIAPSHLHCPHYCKTIARLLRKIRRPPDPPLVCYTLYNIGYGNIV